MLYVQMSSAQLLQCMVLRNVMLGSARVWVRNFARITFNEGMKTYQEGVTQCLYGRCRAALLSQPLCASTLAASTAFYY